VQGASQLKTAVFPPGAVSSTSSLGGYVGQTAYCAANAVLDQLAQWGLQVGLGYIVAFHCRSTSLHHICEEIRHLYRFLNRPCDRTPHPQGGESPEHEGPPILAVNWGPWDAGMAAAGTKVRSATA
jgi:hypothetical protein